MENSEEEVIPRMEELPEQEELDEPKLKVLKSSEKVSWKQLEDHLHHSNALLELSAKEFADYLKKYPEFLELPPVQICRRVIDDLRRFQIDMIHQKNFLMRILKGYLTAKEEVVEVRAQEPIDVRKLKAYTDIFKALPEEDQNNLIWDYFVELNFKKVMGRHGIFYKVGERYGISKENVRMRLKEVLLSGKIAMHLAVLPEIRGKWKERWEKAKK